MKNYENYQLSIFDNDNDVDIFYMVHFKEIKNIFNKCFPCFLSKNFFGSYSKFIRYYFLLSNDKVIAFAKVDYTRKYVYSDKSLDTYTLVDKNLENYKFIYPSLESLCRDNDNKYKGIGSYLLKKISEDVGKSYNYLILVPESLKFKDISSQINCGIIEGYKNSQTELIKYYKKNGFKILDGYYDLDKCIDENNKIKYLYLNVMGKKLR